MYQIVRFTASADFRNVDREIVRTGLTLEEAREHCNDPTTRGDRWFDGFEREDDHES